MKTVLPPSSAKIVNNHWTYLVDKKLFGETHDIIKIELFNVKEYIESFSIRVGPCKILSFPNKTLYDIKLPKGGFLTSKIKYSYIYLEFKLKHGFKCKKDMPVVVLTTSPTKYTDDCEIKTPCCEDCEIHPFLGFNTNYLESIRNKNLILDDDTVDFYQELYVKRKPIYGNLLNEIVYRNGFVFKTEIL